METQPYWRGPLAVPQTFWRHRHIIWQMTRRDVLGRYRGSMLGLAWAFLSPLLLLSIYTFVFGVVFRARWGAAQAGSTVEFALVLFTGLIVFSLFSECVNRAPDLVLTSVSLVKRVVFPLESLVWVTLGSALFHATVSFLVLIIALALAGFPLSWTAALCPLLILPLALLTLGACWLLSSLGVFIRDIGQLVGVLTTAALFLSPVFYPPSAIPDAFRPFVFVNPLSFAIVETREVLLSGSPPSWISLALYYGECWTIAWLGLLWFQKTRPGFADVL